MEPLFTLLVRITHKINMDIPDDTLLYEGTYLGCQEFVATLKQGYDVNVLYCKDYNGHKDVAGELG